MSSFLYREDGWLRLEKQLVSLGSLIEKWQRGKICQKSLALSPVYFLDKYFCLSPMSNLSLTFTCQICQSCFHIRSHCLFYNKYLIFFLVKLSLFSSQIFLSLFHVKPLSLFHIRFSNLYSMSNLFVINAHTLSTSPPLHMLPST